MKIHAFREFKKVDFAKVAPAAAGHRGGPACPPSGARRARVGADARGAGCGA